MATEWWQYVQQHMDRLGLTMASLSRRSGVDRSIMARWREGGAVQVHNVRAIAYAIDRPVVEAVVKAGILEPGDLKVTVIADASQLSAFELADELKRRAELAEELRRQLATRGNHNPVTVDPGESVETAPLPPHGRESFEALSDDPHGLEVGDEGEERPSCR